MDAIELIRLKRVYVEARERQDVLDRELNDLVAKMPVGVILEELEAAFSLATQASASSAPGAKLLAGACYGRLYDLGIHVLTEAIKKCSSKD